MPITCTNRKGLLYYLCQGVTKTGKPRYYFAREPKGEMLEHIPEGYEISESVNGIVSLVKARPAQILPEEIAAVEAAVKRHPKSRNYRVSVKHDQINVYERIGPDADDLVKILHNSLAGLLPPSSATLSRVQSDLDRHAQFTPVMRFVLADAEQRTFGVQRMCYLGSIDDWIGIGEYGKIDELAARLLPKLGTDEFFALY